MIDKSTPFSSCSGNIGFGGCGCIYNQSYRRRKSKSPHESFTFSDLRGKAWRLLGDNADTTGLRLFGASVSDIQRIAGQGSSPTKAASAIER